MLGLHVVYVHFRTTDLLAKSVASVLAGAGEVPALQITVVDNSCDEQVFAELQRLLPAGRVELRRSPTNLGFAAGCNRGAQGGSLSHLLFLNPDTVLPAGSLGAIWERARQHGDEALLGMRHHADLECRYAHAPLRAERFGDELVDLGFAKGWQPRRADRFVARRFELFRRGGPVRVRAVSGGCLATSRTVFERLGGWDEGFWLYGEDMELCARARRRGVRVLYFPEVPVVHWMEASARQLPERVHASRRRGRQLLKRRCHGLLASAAERRLTKAWASVLPRRGDPWQGIEELHDFTLRRKLGSEGAWAVELAHSPLFDNCLSCFPSGDVEEVPGELISGLPAGRYYLRVAEQATAGRWQTTGLWSFTGGELEVAADDAARTPHTEAAAELEVRA